MEEEESLPLKAEIIFEEYVFKLYTMGNVSDINDERYGKFAMMDKVPDPRHFPPIKDALQLHFMIAYFKVHDWKRALSVGYMPIDPIGKGV